LGPPRLAELSVRDAELSVRDVKAFLEKLRKPSLLDRPSRES
jgi:hypothetical protein